MKKYFIPLVFLLFSCSTMETQKEIRYYGYDFRPYTAKGFLFTTEGYDGQYESIASFAAVMYPEVKQIEDQSVLGNTRWAAGEVHAGEVIDSMYARATRMGANAIIRFELRDIQKLNGKIIMEGLQASGFAIKRK